MKISSYALAVSLLSLLPGCGGDSTPSATDPGTPRPTSVSSVVIQAPSNTILVVGQTVTLTGVVYATGGAVLTDRTISWSASPSSVATVSSGGVVTGLGAGVVTVTATCEGHSATQDLTVNEPVVPVAAVAVTAPGTSVAIGTTLQLTATTTGPSGETLTGRTVTWTSEVLAVATVSNAGVVTPLSPGSVSIDAESEGVTGSIALTVTGTSGTEGKLAFTSQPVTAAAGASLGTVRVSVTDSSGTVVTSATTSVTLSISSGTGMSGAALSGTVTQSAASGVAEFSGLSIDKAGTGYTLDASATGLTSATSTTFDITQVQVEVATVTVTPASATVAVSGTQAFTATLKDAEGNVLTGRTVSWSSSAPSVATIDASTGLATGVSDGSATITATTEGKTGTGALTVTTSGTAAKLAFTSQPASAAVGASLGTIRVAVNDASGNVVTTAADAVTLSISTGTGASGAALSGTVMQNAVDGVATFTGISIDKAGVGYTLEASATGLTSATSAAYDVTQMPVATVIVTPASATVAVSGTQAFTATLKDAEGNVLTGRTVSWSSSAPSVATIDASTGVATGIGGGSATITAASEGNTGTATLTVSSGPPVATVTVSATYSSAPPNAVVNGSITATVKDASGNVLTDRVVTWSSSQPSVATIDANAVIQTFSDGTTTFTATSEGISGSVSFAVRTPATITINGGNDQTAAPGATLPVLPSVVVRGAAGNPVAQTLVDLTVTAGGGSAPASVITDNSGVAIFDWTLGASAGANTLTAQIHNTTLSTTFTATAASQSQIVYWTENADLLPLEVTTNGTLRGSITSSSVDPPACGETGFVTTTPSSSSEVYLAENTTLNLFVGGTETVAGTCTTKRIVGGIAMYPTFNASGIASPCANGSTYTGSHVWSCMLNYDGVDFYERVGFDGLTHYTHLLFINTTAQAVTISTGNTYMACSAAEEKVFSGGETTVAAGVAKADDGFVYNCVNGEAMTALRLPFVLK